MRLKREVVLQLMIDKRHDNILGVVPSSYYLGRMFDNNSTRFVIRSLSEELDLNECDVFLRFISGNLDVGKAIVFPTVDAVDEEDDDSDEDDSDNRPICTSSYLYNIGMMYTKKSKLQVQVILDFQDGSEMRSNIVTFNLGDSLPQDKMFYQNLSFLDRLVCDKSIRLRVDIEERELVILDDLENELCRVSIDNMLPKEWW